MIMDIDALLRYYPDMDMEKFMALCDNIKIKRTAQALIALSKNGLIRLSEMIILLKIRTSGLFMITCQS